ncbi:MAG: PAS domain S-box protein [Fimbriimonadaceae bacterium]|nr:PAS domain S-box protein [Fimbriimonadaceae bacterium]
MAGGEQGGQHTVGDLRARLAASDAERARLRSEVAQYRALVEQQTAMLVRLRPDGTIVYANQAFQSYFGRGCGGCYEDLIHRDDRSFVRTLLGSLEPDHPTAECEHRVNGAAAYVRWVQWTLTALFGADGEVDGYQAGGVDCTLRRQAEQELARLVDFTSAVLETTPALVVVLDRAGKIVRYNRATEEFSGYRFAEVQGRFFWDIALRPDDAATGRANFWDVIAGGRPWHGPLDWRCRDGVCRTVDVSTATLNEDGRTQYLLLAGHDISARLAAEQALRESEARFRAVLEAAPFGLHHYRLDGERLTFVGANPAADHLLGVDHQLFRGLSLEAAFPPLAATSLPAAYRDVVRSGRPFHDSQVTYDDREIRGAFDVQAFATGPQTLAVMFRDITEEARAAAAVAESEARLRAIFDASSDGILVLRQGLVTAANPAAERLFGRAAADLCGRPCGELCGEQGGGEAVVAALRNAASEAQRFSWQVLRADGQVRLTEVVATGVEQPGGPAVLLVLRALRGRARLREVLVNIAGALTAETGPEFFRSLAQQVGQTLEATAVLIAARPTPGDRYLETVGAWVRGELVSDFSYSWAGTASERALLEGEVVCERDARAQHPDDLLLEQLGIDSYLGLRLLDSQGQAIGVITALSAAPLDDVAFAQSLLRIFGTRVAAEIERLQTVEALTAREELYRALTDTLPEMVALRQGRHLLYCNPAWQRRLGTFNGAASDSDFWLQRLAPADRARVSGYVAARERGESAPRDFECQILDRSEQPFGARVQVLPTLYHGQAAWLLVVTERPAANS